MPLKNLISRWKTDPTVAVNISAWETKPAQEPQYREFPADFHPSIAKYLRTEGIHALYSHQLEVWNYLESGGDVVVATGTASGKTLAYNLPVLHNLLSSDISRALYIFPTKALAQDQYDELVSMVNFLNASNQKLLNPGVYDGDTSNSARPEIRKNARLILTNPDMLHTGILPHHTNWMPFFQNLKYVIIDEMHTYRGVFGSHVANVIRRLTRIARFYGTDPQFILTSATIANPGELAEKLVEKTCWVVDRDGAGRGEKHFLIYNPPIINEDLGIRRSLLQETVRLSEDLLAANVQTVIFGRTRRGIELALSYLRQQVSVQPSGSKKPVKKIIRGYRSGYLPAQRREIENGLRDGSVRAVVATNALELGIDIGALEAAVLAGYPGTIASSWQQAGRAGRGSLPSLAVMVVSANPLDQYLARFPEYFFTRSAEQALINPDNLLILLGHLRCAAFELPFRVGDTFGRVNADDLKALLEIMQAQNTLHQAGGKFFWMAQGYPAQEISLRSASPESVLLQVENQQGVQIIGEVDSVSSLWMTHPGAVYLHEGQVFQVDELDLEKKIVHLSAYNGDFYTEPRRETTVQIMEVTEETKVTGAQKGFGEVLVTSQVIGYRKRRWYTGETLGYGEVQLPSHDLHTEGYWILITNETIDRLQDEGLWNNAPNYYGPLWDRQRSAARHRDNYCCQNCGVPERDRAHDVHHKIPFRSFSNPDDANQLHNLVTLCPSCHRAAESAVRVRSGLGGVAYTLSNLAPLFLMCDPGDLGVHADSQSLFANPGESTNCGLVIYDQIPAGIGLSRRLFSLHLDLVNRAMELVESCPCPDGCPSCVGPGGEEGSGGKPESLALLKALMTSKN